MGSPYWRAIVHDPVSCVVHFFQALAQRIDAEPSMEAHSETLVSSLVINVDF